MSVTAGAIALRSFRALPVSSYSDEWADVLGQTGLVAERSLLWLEESVEPREFPNAAAGVQRKPLAENLLSMPPAPLQRFEIVPIPRRVLFAATASILVVR